MSGELSKELVTKVVFYGETKAIRQEIETLIQEMENEILRLDRNFTVMFVVLFFTIVFLNQNALEYLVRVLGLMK